LYKFLFYIQYLLYLYINLLYSFVIFDILIYNYINILSQIIEMLFSSHFSLLNYIITSYDSISFDLILIDNKKSFEEFIPSNDYIRWHKSYVGTDKTFNKLNSGIIPFNLIKEKSKKYYMNIFINLRDNFLEYAFYDIFFNKIKIAVLLSGFMRNYNLTLQTFKTFFPNYQVDYYIVTYDIVGIGNYKSDDYSNDKFNIDDLKNIIPQSSLRKYIIKEYAKNSERVSDDLHINKLYYQTLNMYECYNLTLDEDYFIYIRVRPDLIFENLDTILENNLDDIINNKIILHDKTKNTLSDVPFDGFAICNLNVAQKYFKFHFDLEFYKDSPEQTLYHFLLRKNIEIVRDNICQINRQVITGAINRAVLLRGRR